MFKHSRASTNTHLRVPTSNSGLLCNSVPTFFISPAISYLLQLAPRGPILFHHPNGFVSHPPPISSPLHSSHLTLDLDHHPLIICPIMQSSRPVLPLLGFLCSYCGKRPIWGFLVKIRGLYSPPTFHKESIWNPYHSRWIPPIPHGICFG